MPTETPTATERAVDWMSGGSSPRAQAIRELCEKAGMPDLADGYILQGTTVEQVESILFDSLADANRMKQSGG